MKTVCLYKRKMSVLRTALAMLLISTVLVLCPSGRVCSASSSADPDSASYMIYEADTRQTLQKLNADAPADCSLLARLMTCIVVLEADGVSVTDYISPKRNSTSLSERYELFSSNQYMVDHLIKSVVLCNADNAARVLSEYITEDTENFTALMNKKAADLGMSNTYFTSPDGAQDGIQRTTVSDMTVFWAYAMNNPQFRNAASSPVTHIWGGTAVVNECKLLRNASFPDASLTAGVYTLYDSENSLGTTMFYITSGASNTELPPTRLSLVMTGYPDESGNELGKSYIENALLNFTKRGIVSKGDIITSVEIEGGELTLVSCDSIYCMVPADVSDYVYNISYNVTYKNVSDTAGRAPTLSELEPPIDKGTVIGTANYILKDGSVLKVDIAAGNTIRSDNKTVNIFYKTIQENTDIFVIISVLILFELALIICVIAGKIRRRR